MKLFDLFILRQSARLHEPGTKQSDLNRGQMRRLRQSLLAGQKTTPTKPEESDVSRELAILWLLNSNDDEPF